MAYPTFSDLIQRCLVELRQEPGISVQQYSEDNLAAILQRVFNTFFDHYWWPVYMTHGEAMVLNGVTGRVTTQLVDKIKRPDDVRFIWYESDVNPLSVLPPTMNPHQATFRRYYAHTNDDSIFMILPPTSTGTVRVTYRTLPSPFLPNDEVRLDADLLVVSTCFNYVSDDEDSPATVKKFAELAGKREGQLREAMNKGPVPIGGGAMSPFTDWMTNP